MTVTFAERKEAQAQQAREIFAMVGEYYDENPLLYLKKSSFRHHTHRRRLAFYLMHSLLAMSAVQIRELKGIGDCFNVQTIRSDISQFRDYIERGWEKYGAVKEPLAELKAMWRERHPNK